MENKKPPAFRTNKFAKKDMDTLKANKSAPYPPSLNKIPKQDNPQ
ncbi:hypothetical protein [Paenibacillus cymbidii]|nr:hypothetical protein [Paenibacillus cymbidii]